MVGGKSVTLEMFFDCLFVVHEIGAESIRMGKGLTIGEQLLKACHYATFAFYALPEV